MYSPRSRRRPGVTAGLALLGLLAASAPGLGVDALSVDLGSLEWGPLSARGLRLEIDWREDAARFRLTAEALRMGEPGLEVSDLELQCERGRIAGDTIDCSRGTAAYTLGGQRTEAVPVAFLWRDGSRVQARIAAESLGAAAGRIDLEGRLQEGAWRVELKGTGLDLARVQGLASDLGVTSGGASVQGRADLELEAAGQGPDLLHGRWELKYADLGFADADQAYLGQGLSGTFSGRLAEDGEAWTGAWSNRLDAGEVLTPAIYLSASAAPLVVGGDVRIPHDLQSLQLVEGRIDQGERLRAGFALGLELGERPGLGSLELRLPSTDAGALYRDFLQPALAGELAPRVGLRGRLQGELSYEAAGPARVALQLEDLDLSVAGEGGGDAEPVLKLDGIAGALRWSADTPAPPSRLAWSGGRLFGDIDLGPSQLELRAQGPRVELARPTSLPVLDGALRIERLVYDAQDPEKPHLAFDGLLEPVSLGDFARAVGWPPLSGKISGMLPGLSLEGNALAVDGVILVRAFDGRLLIRNLRLSDPFGAWPVLTADLRLHDLDLEQLTETFAFGRITGKLEGQVKDLRLENWRPVAFDARLQTPPEDDSRHRISQRAIENISKLGGSGAAGVISRGFLSLFDDFGYQRLGIECRLKGGVCRMDGVEPAENGYYLVRGGGVPQVDVKGFNQRIDWNRLVDELASIPERGAPKIE